MKPDLLANITAYKDYFLVISGAYGNRVLTILDGDLRIVSEHDFTGIQMWGQDFHIDDVNSRILISVTTTERFQIDSKRYQGFNTLWYELTETSKGFQLQQIDTWQKSDIKCIKSKVFNGERIWTCIQDENFINEAGNKGRNEIIGIAQTSNLEIPRFDYSSSIQDSYLSQNFDFEVTSNDILISSIGNISNDTPTLIRINRLTKNLDFVELDIPLKKLHNFHDTVIKNVNNHMFAYFWITSSEYCKKYVFEIYTTKINDKLSDSSFVKALNSDYAHSFNWNNNGKVAYRTGKGETPCLFGEINENGQILELKKFENAVPILINDSDIILGLIDERKRMKVVE